MGLASDDCIRRAQRPRIWVAPRDELGRRRGAHRRMLDAGVRESTRVLLRVWFGLPRRSTGVTTYTTVMTKHDIEMATTHASTVQHNSAGLM